MIGIGHDIPTVISTGGRLDGLCFPSWFFLLVENMASSTFSWLGPRDKNCMHGYHARGMKELVDY